MSGFRGGHRGGGGSARGGGGGGPGGGRGGMARVNVPQAPLPLNKKEMASQLHEFGFAAEVTRSLATLPEPPPAPWHIVHTSPPCTRQRRHSSTLIVWLTQDGPRKGKSYKRRDGNRSLLGFHRKLSGTPPNPFLIKISSLRCNCPRSQPPPPTTPIAATHSHPPLAAESPLSSTPVQPLLHPLPGRRQRAATHRRSPPHIGGDHPRAATSRPRATSAVTATARARCWVQTRP